MPTRIWNRPDLGIWQTDTVNVSSSARFIQGSNVTGLKTSLGLTLGPKVNKLFFTNGKMRNFFIDDSSTEGNFFVYGDGGEIYRLDGADYTPIYTHTSLDTIEGFFEASNDYFFQAGSSDLAKANAEFTDVDEEYYPGVRSTQDNVSTVIVRDNIYYPNGSQITKFNDDGVFVKTLTGFNNPILALVPLGKSIYVYTEDRVYTYNTDIDTITNESACGFAVRGHTVLDNVTYIATKHGGFKAGNGWQFSDISTPITTNRLNNNSYQKKYDFGLLGNVGNTISTDGQSIYLSSNDGVAGVYEYDKLAPGFNKGLHSIITQTYDGTPIDEIYCVAASRDAERLYFAYKAGTEYGVNYIDTDENTTAQLGYAVTEVFTANTSYVKEPQELRITVEGVSGNNYVKLYERVNNGTWSELTTITGKDGIVKKVINNYTKENIEVQFKVELYNEGQTADAPIVRELYYDYKVIPK